MAKIPAKITDRIASGLKRFQPILANAKARDINESDTVVIVTDLLQEIFGFDKYSEITSEHAIRGTFCDLAIKLDGRLILLLEVKAIGLDLKDNHVKQAVDYAANQGCEWAILTNGLLWQAYRVAFEKPIRSDLVLEVNLSELNPKSATDIERLWLISREGIQKSGLAEYQAQREALSRFTLGALLQTDPIVDLLRRELRRVSPNVKIEAEEIRQVLLNDVLKREVLEGEQAQAAKRSVSRAAKRSLRKKDSGKAEQSSESSEEQAGPTDREPSE